MKYECNYCGINSPFKEFCCGSLMEEYAVDVY